MRQDYCTLFNKNYLGRGLLAYQSLLANDPNMYLWVLALDTETETILKNLALPHMQVVALAAVEGSDVLAVKSERSVAEYCWTLTPYWMQWVMQHNEERGCTYVDADLYFFNAPAQLWEDFWESAQSVFITPHFYTPALDYSATCGKYCVQFLSFKPTAEGRAILAGWKQDCLDWCFNRIEPGRFGDQKYLDNWPIKDPNAVRICTHRGCVGPWNVQQYTFAALQQLPVVFYHFHALKWYQDRVDLSDYQISQAVKETVYRPYVDAFLDLEKQLKMHLELPYLPDRQVQRLSLWQAFKRKLRGRYHVQHAPIGALCKT